jgi:hypothetical protein
MSVMLAGALLAACAGEAPIPTASSELPVFSDPANASANPNRRNFGTPLAAGEEVMPAGVVNKSRARGFAMFRLNAAGDELTYMLIVANIENVFQAHIHQGAAGVNGPIVVWLYPSTTPGAGPVGQGRIQGVIAKGTIRASNLVGPLAGRPLSALTETIITSNAYVNVHTDDGAAPPNTGPGDFPGGEIRGQVKHRGH